MQASKTALSLGPNGHFERKKVRVARGLGLPQQNLVDLRGLQGLQGLQKPPNFESKSEALKD